MGKLVVSEPFLTAEITGIFGGVWPSHPVIRGSGVLTVDTVERGHRRLREATAVHFGFP